MPEPYRYRPLSGPRCVRVLELEPAADKSAPLVGKLNELDLAAKPRPWTYEALSYVWGYPKGDQPIVCDGQEVLVTENCEAAMRHLRHRFKRRMLWIDAVCIDQTNILECNHQVAMMGNVYQNAKCVRIWLGSPENALGVKRYKALLQIAKFGFKLPDWSPVEYTFSSTIGSLCSILGLDDDGSFGKQMAHSAWAKRVWTVQECSFATAATVHYGSISCSWDDASRALDAIYTLAYDVLRVENEEIKTLYRLRALTRRVVKDRTRPKGPSSSDSQSTSGDKRDEQSSEAITAILEALQYTEAADPKDKAFGIYGLLQILDVGLPLPDYTKSIAQIYAETLVALHKARGDINLRHFCTPDNNPHGLPSWVPDWTNPTDVQFFRRGIDKFRASKGNLALDLDAQESHKLHIKAVVIDTIATVGSIYPIEDVAFKDAEPQAVVDNWMEISGIDAKSINRKSTDPSTLSACKVLAEAIFGPAHIFRHRGCEYNVQAVAEWFTDKPRAMGIPECFRRSKDGSMTELYQFRFKGEVLPSWRGQRVFKSKSDRLGMAWWKTKPGDLVILAAGCDVPLVVRVYGMFGKSYNYIGPAFLHGAMYGEQWPSNSAKELRNMILV